MTLTGAMLTLLGLALFSLLALLGDRRFADYDRLPVHWDNAGRADLYAPRRVGLTIFLVLGMFPVLLLAVSRQSDILIAGAQFAVAAANILYFNAIARTLAEA